MLLPAVPEQVACRVRSSNLLYMLGDEKHGQGGKGQKSLVMTPGRIEWAMRAAYLLMSSLSETFDIRQHWQSPWPGNRIAASSSLKSAHHRAYARFIRCLAEKGARVAVPPLTTTRALPDWAAFPFGRPSCSHHRVPPMCVTLHRAQSEQPAQRAKAALQAPSLPPSPVPPTPPTERGRRGG